MSRGSIWTQIKSTEVIRKKVEGIQAGHRWDKESSVSTVEVINLTKFRRIATVPISTLLDGIVVTIRVVEFSFFNYIQIAGVAC